MATGLSNGTLSDIQHPENNHKTVKIVHPEKLRLRLRIPPQVEKKNTVDTLTDGILGKCKYLYSIYRFFILFISKRVMVHYGELVSVKIQ